MHVLTVQMVYNGSQYKLQILAIDIIGGRDCTEAGRVSECEGLGISWLLNLKDHHLKI